MSRTRLLRPAVFLKLTLLIFLGAPPALANVDRLSQSDDAGGDAEMVAVSTLPTSASPVSPLYLPGRPW